MSTHLNLRRAIKLPIYRVVCKPSVFRVIYKVLPKEGWAVQTEAECYDGKVFVRPPFGSRRPQFDDRYSE